MMKTYSEMALYRTLKDRFAYLKLDGYVGRETFGGHRFLNQKFYNSPEWRSFRNRVIMRDGGFELGVEPFEINGKIYIHHINPITIDDIINRSSCLFDLDNAISCSFGLHEAIHYGDLKYLDKFKLVRRTENDTCPWK